MAEVNNTMVIFLVPFQMCTQTVFSLLHRNLGQISPLKSILNLVNISFLKGTKHLNIAFRRYKSSEAGFLKVQLGVSGT
jgi:hypothetical protein